MNNGQKQATKIWENPELKSYGSVQEITQDGSPMKGSVERIKPRRLRRRVVRKIRRKIRRRNREFE